MDDSWDAAEYEAFVFDLKTPKHAFAQEAPMSLEDQHEWLEARRVTLLAQLELVLAAEDDVPAWLLTEWTRLQRARDALLRHRLCQENWQLFVGELRRLRQQLSQLLRWPVCDSWDTRQLRQLSSDWIIVSCRLQASRYHRSHVLTTRPAAEDPRCSPTVRSCLVTPAHMTSSGDHITPAEPCRSARLKSSGRKYCAAEPSPGPPRSPVFLTPRRQPIKNQQFPTSPLASADGALLWRRTSSYIYT